jgi:hypothetical protein
MAYGIKASPKVLEPIADYVHAQGLTGRRVRIEELFAPEQFNSIGPWLSVVLSSCFRRPPAF